MLHLKAKVQYIRLNNKRLHKNSKSNARCKEVSINFAPGEMAERSIAAVLKTVEG